MIEVVNTRKDSACVWLSWDQLFNLQKACTAMGFDLDLDGKADMADVMLDLANDCYAVIKEMSDEESDY